MGNGTLPLAGKVALVTGAARGLGRAYALRLARLGADVVINDINLHAAKEYDEALAEGCETVSDEIQAMGRRSIGIVADVTDPEACKRMVAQIVSEFGRLDILINNAGGQLAPNERSYAATMPPEDLQWILGINLMGTIYCCQAAAPVMKEQRSGRIVNVGSQAGLEVRTWPDLKPARVLKTELDHVHDLAFSPDGTMLAAVGGTPAKRGTVELYRWPAGELIRRFGPHRDLVYAVDWRADSAGIATAAADGMVGGADRLPVVRPLRLHALQQQARPARQTGSGAGPDPGACRRDVARGRTGRAARLRRASERRALRPGIDRASSCPPLDPGGKLERAEILHPAAGLSAVACARGAGQ